MLTRRSLGAALAAPFYLRAQPQAARARIKLDTDRKIGAIDPKIYGNFAEHLGRCIQGGIFEEGSPLSDARGYRRDVMDAVRQLHVTLLRWPGGNFSSNYRWRDGIGPRDKRPARLEMAWGTVEDNRFGTHEFLDYVEMLGIEPYVCANFGTGTWEEAQQWVEYCNVGAGTAMTRLREQNGRKQPWNVRYWGLGNEIDGPWQMGHRSAEDYGKFALEGAKMMKWTDPGIKLIAAGSSDFGPRADWTNWNRTVLAYLKNHADYLSLHTYVGNSENDSPEFLASSLELDGRIRTAEGIIRAALTGGPRDRKIYIAFDEWNVSYRASADSKKNGRRILEERYNLEDALVIATFLNTFINNAHSVKIANLAQLVNVIAPILTDDKGLFLQTIFYPLQLFSVHSRGMALEVFVDGPAYESKRHGPTPCLDVSCALDADTVVLNVVNRDLERDIEADIEMEDRPFAGPIEVAQVNGPDIKAENTFGSTKVRAEMSREQARANRLRYRFPAHSYTMLKGKLA